MNNGKIFAISVSEKKGQKKTNVKNADLKADCGIIGDAHFGFNHRQISLLSYESILEFNKKGVDLLPGDFAENITTKDIDLELLKVGDLLGVGENVLIEIAQRGKECHDKCEILKQVGDCIMPRYGIFAKVIKGGRIFVGDKICIK